MTTFKANRKFPNPITVTDDPRSHTLALQQVIEALNVGQRRTREIGSSYVRVQELVDVGLIEIVGNQLKLTNLGQSVASTPGASALADLTDVDLTGLADGDVLVWNSSTSMWEPSNNAAFSATDMYDQTLSNLADVAVYLPSDGDVLTYDAATGLWGSRPAASGLYPTLTPPISADYAWANQGSASVEDKLSRMVMTVPYAGGANLRVLKKALPSTPYTITAAIGVTQMGTASSSNATGITLRDNAGGLRVFYLVSDTGANYFGIGGWTSATAFSSYVFIVNTTHVGGLLWLRITDDGTTRKYYHSSNGKDWSLTYSEGRTIFITATEFGLAALNNVGSIDLRLSIHHLAVANSILGDEP
jgi:hypothetical protein